MSEETIQIKQETNMLSRFVGTIFAKWTTFILLIPAFFYVTPVSVYIMLLTLLLPLLFQAVLGDQNSDSNPPLLLTYTEQKYHFSPKKYRAEKNANPFLLLSLLIWQFTLPIADFPVPWRIYPGGLLVVNIIIRLIVTILFRLHLHNRFFHLNILDEK